MTMRFSAGYCRHLASHGNPQRLVETTLGRQHPSHAHESGTFQDARQFVPQHRSVDGNAVMRLPARGSLASDVQMKGVFALIHPVPQLENDATPPCVREETWTLNGWSFANQLVVVSDAGYKNYASW